MGGNSITGSGVNGSGVTGSDASENGVTGSGVGTDVAGGDNEGKGNHAHLSVWQASCIITGYGVGSGIMALPYLANRAGLIASAIVLAVAFFFSYLMHMMLAEISLGSGRGAQVVSMFRMFLFRGKYGKAFTMLFFIVTTLVLFANLSAYVAGGGEVLEAAGIPPVLAMLIFYAAAAIIVFFGLKVLGISESVSIIAIIAIIATLAIASLFHLNNPILSPTGNVREILAFFGMAMFAFVAFFSIPQVVDGLDQDPVKVRKSIVLGLGMNLVFIVVIVLCSLAASTEVTDLAMIGWSRGIGLWAQILGSAFTILAMLTTYWSISLALSEIIGEQTHWNTRICWLLATLPSLLLALFVPGGFMSLMRTAGGLVAILIAVMVVPTYRTCRREKGELLLSHSLGSTPMQILVIVMFVLMAVGSAVAI